jgi:pimeloyl-ACP methyl ester carboxylesterase
MGFAEYGSLKGTPTFFLHGSPGSRYDGIGLIDIAKKLNIRAICPDRPGHGLSTF